jgi:hypothetical protein
MLRVRIEGGSGGTALPHLRWLDGHGEQIGKLGMRIPADSARRTLRNFGPTPEGTSSALFRWGADREAAGRWRLTHVSLHRLGPSSLAGMLKQRAIWKQRIGSLIDILRGDDPAGDPALAFRLTETRRILSALGDSSLPQWIVGRGLGATLHLGVEGYDNRGHRVWYEDVNYIHNFYLFLPYKLGLAGTILVLAALAAWAGWTWRRTLSSPLGKRRAFLAAASAAWIAYSVWAITSPEIVDFSMAPLFGLLVAAGADVGEDETDPVA